MGTADSWAAKAIFAWIVWAILYTYYRSTGNSEKLRKLGLLSIVATLLTVGAIVYEFTRAART